MLMTVSKSIQLSGSFSGDRISSSCDSSSSTFRSDVSVDPLVRQKPCLHVRAIRGFMRGTVEDSAEKSSARVSVSAVLAPGRGADAEVGHSCSFLTARSGEELLSCIWKKVQFGHISSDVASRLEELYYNYHSAVMQSGDLNASELILSNMAVTFDRILLDIKDPFKFALHHKAIRTPFDYYMFGQNYFRPLIDFRRSYVGNISLFLDMELKLQQTEADPYLIALLLERTNPLIAEKMVFLAGDRVIMDQLSKPFSMGRNLLCVYSKKHIGDDPELVDMKRASNTNCLSKMTSLLRLGSQIIWVAPSGGRDRPDPFTGELHPAPFDTLSMDNMRRILDHSGVPGHMYPLALLCYDVMPPPPEVEKQIGERRKISFNGIGLSVAPQMNSSGITAGCTSLKEAKQAFASAYYDSVVEQYDVLKSAIYGQYRGADASPNSAISLSQPWL